MKLRCTPALLAALAILTSCNEQSPAGADPASGGSAGLSGSAGLGGFVPTSNANTSPSTCGGNCETDLEQARQALEAGEFQRAFDLYRCANSPTAAFGAGLTRALLALEGASADALMADFGLQPFEVDDVLGPRGILSREAARWVGQGRLTLSGGQSGVLVFSHARNVIESTDAYASQSFSARGPQAPQTPSLDLAFAPGSEAPLRAGAQLTIAFDCSSQYPTRTLPLPLEYVSLEFKSGENDYWCSLPYSVAAVGCQPNGGSIRVTSAASRPDDPVAYTLSGVLLSCESFSATTSDSISIRVSGSFSARAVGAELDLSGTHALFQDDFDIEDVVPVNRQLTDLISHAGGVAAELEEAGCFFEKAAAATGVVFTVPGALHGGADMPVTRGDTQVLAAAMLLGAAAGHIARAYEVDMPANHVFCDSCPSEATQAREFNSAFGSTFHPERFVEARRLVRLGLPLLDAGMGNLDGTSILVNNPRSAPGLASMRDAVQALRRSLDVGSVLMPHASPDLTVNLIALLGEPRNPKLPDVTPLIYRETCEYGDCWGNTSISSVYADRYFDGAIEGSWDDGHEWTGDGATEDTVDEIETNLARYLNLDL